MRYLTLLSLLATMAFPARADFSINLDAGELTSPVTQPMQADNLSGSLNGSLLLILDLGSSQSLSNNVNPGNYVSGTNFVLAAGGFNTNGGTNETLTSFYVSSTPAASVGDVIALRWFPQITLSQYNSGSLPLAGQSFGSYTPNPVGSTPDGGDQWLVPTSGLIDLSMYTVNSDGGGSQAALAGYAGSQIETIPEPSTYTLLGMGLFLLFFHRRRALTRFGPR